MQKIIGRGVLLLTISKNLSVKFGYQLSTEGIRFLKLGEGMPAMTISELLQDQGKSSKKLSGTDGHIILNDLPASPGDAFYGVTFEARNIGTANEFFTLTVTETNAFAHGPQTHFSDLDFTFRYDDSGLSIEESGKVTTHLGEGVFGTAETIPMTPSWNQNSQRLEFASATDEMQMDSIGKLSNLKIELGSEYDRWDRVQGLYTFEGTGTDAATHDISIQAAPSLYFGGKKIPGNQQGSWTTQGVALKNGRFLASLEEPNNPIIASIQDAEAFSIELWLKPASLMGTIGQIFGIEGLNDKGSGFRSYYSLTQEGVFSETLGARISSKFRYNPAPMSIDPADQWGKPFKSPAHSLSNSVMHVVFTCDATGMQRIFINGVQVAEKEDKKFHNLMGAMPPPSDIAAQGLTGNSALGGLSQEMAGSLWAQTQASQLPGATAPAGQSPEEAKAKQNDPMQGVTLFNPTSEDKNRNLRIALGNFSTLIGQNNFWSGEIHQMAIYIRALAANEVQFHYQPATKISGDFKFSHVVAPLAEASLPFDLQLKESTAVLTAYMNGDFRVRDQLRFRQISLVCHKSIADPWTFESRFQTQFWGDLFELDTHQSSDTDPTDMLLSSPVSPSAPVTASGLGMAKYKDISLKAGDHAWELSFGENPEYGLISMVLGNSIPDYGSFRLGGAKLVLPVEPSTAAIRLEGKWLGEDVVFESHGTGDDMVLKLKEGTQLEFDMNFSVSIPAPVHEASGIRIGEDIVLSNTDVEHKDMHIGLDIELQKAGFFAVLTRNFDYGTSKNLSLGERHIYEAPASKNALLDEILQEVADHINSLFATHRRDQEIDYLTPLYPWPLLGASGGKVAGRFLEEDLELTIEAESGRDFTLTGNISHDKPFSVTLPAPVHETSGIRTLKDIELTNENMHFSFDFELKRDEFFGTLDRSFYYPDNSAPANEIHLAERQLFWPPMSKKDLLRESEIAEEVRAHADTLFADRWSGVEDFYTLEFTRNTARILLHASPSTDDTISSVIPNLGITLSLPISTGDIRITKDNQDNYSLRIRKGIDQNAVDTAWEALLSDIQVNALTYAQFNLLRQRIVERLPLDYNQVLKYYYGWHIKEGYIDLHPGMRLRIDLQHYQFVQASDPTARKGFVGGGSLYIPVNSYAYPLDQNSPLQGTVPPYSQKLGFGPFLSSIGTHVELGIQEKGAGGLIDLLEKGNRKAFYRLVYPNQFATGPDSERVVKIVGADNYADLLNESKEGVISFFFRDRAMITPEIQIFVSDKAVFVPIGTTLRQLAEMYDNVPGAGLGQDIAAFTGKSRPLRLIHEGVNSKPEYRFLHFAADTSQSNTDLLDLPVIKGDRYYF